MFFGESSLTIKVSFKAKKLAACQQLNEHDFQCPEGTKLKIQGLKIHLKKPMIFRHDGKHWQLLDPATAGQQES